MLEEQKREEGEINLEIEEDIMISYDRGRILIRRIMRIRGGFMH